MTHNLTLAVVFLVAVQSLCPLARAQTPVDDYPNRKAFALNEAMRALYGRVQETHASAAQTAHNISDLRQRLRECRELDSSIAAGLQGEGAAELLKRARIGRALAWIHAWATFGQLTYRVSVPAAPAGSSDSEWEALRTTLRSQLIDFGGAEESAFSLLVETYAQIEKSEGGATDPLRRILATSDYLPTLLGFVEMWNAGENKGPVGHRYFIPSTEDLVGKSADRAVPDGQNRHLLSLWGLVNLQLDTWHNLAVDPGQGAPYVTALRASDLGYRDLANWMKSLASAPLGSFGTDSLVRPVDKLSRFLNWRQRHSTQPELDAFVEEVYSKRVTPGGDLVSAFGDLLVAARPEADNTVLYDAAYWARYMYLLSLRRPRQAIRDKASEAAYLQQWAALGAGAFDLRRTGDARGRPSLRWNVEPPEGSLPAVLSDMTHAGWAEILFERDVRELASGQFDLVTKGRYQGESGTPEFRTKLSGHGTALRQHVMLLHDAYRSYVGPYFEATYLNSGAGPTSKELSALPTRTPKLLLNARKAESTNFRASATIAEQNRGLSDLETFAGEISASLALQGSISTTFSDADPTLIAATLDALPIATPFSYESAHSLPYRSAADYKADLEDAATLLQNAVLDLSAVRKTMAAAYATKAAALEAARLELRAELVGQRLVEKAKEIAEIYGKIASLEAEEEDLQLKISQLEQEGWANSVQRSDTQLASVERLRDLAAARVDGLLEAAQKAQSLIELETEELKELGNQFKGYSTQIEKRRHAAAVLSVIQAAVGVLGAALAPITGGASIAVATIVNAGINTYRTIKNTNWSDKNAALAAIGAIGSDFATAINAGVSQFGSDKAKQMLRDAKEFLAEQKQKLSDATVQAKQLLDGISRLGSREQIANAAAALAAGIPVTVVTGGKVKFDVGDKKIIFTDPNLAKDLKGLLDSGGAIVNDLQLRNKFDLRNLPELPDPQLRAELRAAIEGAAKQLPPGIFKKWQGMTDAELNAARQSYEQAVAKLSERISDPSTPISALRSLAQVVAGGWLIVTDSGVELKVSALAPPIQREAEAFEKRLADFKATVTSSALQSVMEQFNARRDKIIADGQAASNTNDDATLDKIASQIPAYIDQTKADIKKVADELRDAQLKLEDAKTATQIAYYDSRATRAFANASAARVEKADVSVKRAALEKQRAAAEYEVALLSIQKQDYTAKAAAARVRSLEIDVARTYEACLDAGFDPLVAGGPDDPLARPPAGTARALFSPYESDVRLESWGQIYLARMADDVLGLVRWHSLVWREGDLTDKSPAEEYAALLNAVAYLTPAEAALKLKEIGGRAHEAYARLAAGKPGKPARLTVAIAEVNTEPKRKVFWIYDMTPVERDAVLARIPAEVADLAPHVIGTIKIRLAPNVGSDPKNVPYFSLGPKTNAFYADATELYVSCDGCSNLKFVALPPEIPVENPGSLSLGVSHHIGGNDGASQILSSATLILVLQNWEKKLIAFENLQLTGALGEWEFLVLDMTDPASVTLAERKRQAATLATIPFHFNIAYFAVSPKARP